MPENHYVGTDGNMTDANNWASTRGGAGGSSAGTPATGEDVYIENLDHALATNVTGFGAQDLESLTISLAPGGSIGASGASLTIAVSNSAASKMTVVNKGGGAIYFTAGTNGVDALNLIGTGTSEFYHTGGTIANAYVGPHSTFRVKSGATATTIYAIQGKVIVENGASNITALWVSNGTALVASTQVAALYLLGGRVVMTGDSNISSTSSIVRGSHYLHLSSGIIADISVYPGGIASAAGAPYPFTVTQSAKYIGGMLFEDSDANITYAAAPLLIGLSA